MLELLSEIDKWSQKYMLYRKGSAGFIALLMISVAVFFLNLSSVKISATCLVFCFISVIGIKWCLAKMDEFKALYVNTVPMIDPEKDFAEEKAILELERRDEAHSVQEVMESFVTEEVSVTTDVQVTTEQESLFQEMIEDIQIEAIETEADILEAAELAEEVEAKTEAEVLETTEPAEEVETETLEVAELGQELVETLILEPFDELSEAVARLETEDAEQGEDFQPESDEVFVSSPVELSLEDQILAMLSDMLKAEFGTIEMLSAKVVGNYFTIYSNKKILMRLKLTGRKQYVLTHLSEQDVKTLGLEYEAPSKGEAYLSRVTFTGLDVLSTLNAHLIELYRRCHKL